MSSRRARGRGNSRGGRQQNIRNQQMDSNGPGGRIRGTPQQVLDRYLALARDASSAGDTVLAENLLQHAEHYTRLLNAAAPQQQNQNQQPNQHQGNGRDDQAYANGDGYGEDAGDAAAANGQGDYQRQPQGGQSEDNPQPAAAEQQRDWSAGDQPADGDQPQSPPRRRRRSRFQRQQEQEGSENAAASADGNVIDTNPVPPIDLSAAAAEPLSLEPAPEQTEQPA